MKILKPVTVVLLTSLSLGCASMFVPGEDKLGKLPIYKMGDNKPEGNEYILHIPAGTEIPIDFSINGNLIKQAVADRTLTSINQELYLYKHWASLDGMKWHATRDLIHMPIELSLDPQHGLVKITIDRK